MIIRARTSGTSIGSLKMWILSIFCFGLFFISSVNCLAVMSVDLGSEWMKIAVVSVRFQIILASKKSTDKYLLEALILATINPFIWQQIVHWITRTIQVQHMFSTCCVHKLFLFLLSKQFVYTTCVELVFPCNSKNNLLSYYELIAAEMTASDKDSLVLQTLLQYTVEIT